MSFVLLTVVLMVAGLILLGAEIFVIPGFGVVGILGIASLIGAVVTAWTQLGSIWGVLALGAGVSVAGILVWMLPRTRAGRSLVLGAAQAGSRAGRQDLVALVGKVGTAVTPLRPSGNADFEDQSIDVITDGDYVAPGTRVRIVRVEGRRVVVEPVLDAPTQESVPREGEL